RRAQPAGQLPRVGAGPICPGGRRTGGCGPGGLGSRVWAGQDGGQGGGESGGGAERIGGGKAGGGPQACRATHRPPPAGEEPLPGGMKPASGSSNPFPPSVIMASSLGGGVHSRTSIGGGAG